MYVQLSPSARVHWPSRETVVFACARALGARSCRVWFYVGIFFLRFLSSSFRWVSLLHCHAGPLSAPAPVQQHRRGVVVTATVVTVDGRKGEGVCARTYTAGTHTADDTHHEWFELNSRTHTYTSLPYVPIIIKYVPCYTPVCIVPIITVTTLLTFSIWCEVLV